MPIHQEVKELASRTFYTGDEWDRMWAKKCRRLKTGAALVRLVDDPKLYEVAIERSAVGYLGWDAAMLRSKLPQVIERVHEFIEANFRSEFFTSPALIEAQTQCRLDQVLRPALTLHRASAPAAVPQPPSSPSPFAE